MKALPGPELANDAPDVSPLKSLANLWSVIWRRKALVGLGLVVGLVLGGLAYVQAVPIFQSSAQMLVIKKRPDVILQNPAERSGYTEDYLATHIILMSSEEVLSRAARRVDASALSTPPPGGNAMGLLRGGLSVSRDKDQTSGPTNILTIAMRSASPADSLILLKAVIEGYKDFLSDNYGAMNDDTVKFITNAQNLLQKDLAKKQENLQTICLKNPLAIKAKDGVHSFQERISQIEIKQARLDMRQKEIETRRKVIDNALRDGMRRSAIVAMLKEPADAAKTAENPARALENVLTEMRIQYEDLTQTFGPNHPQVASLNRRMELIRDRLKKLGDVDQGNADQDPLDNLLHALKAEYDENRLMLDSLYPLLKDERARAEEMAKYLILEEEARNELNSVRQLYGTIIERLRQINLAREAGGFDAHVVTPGSPGAKVAPLPITYGALAVFAGLALGFTLAYLADYSDKSFRSPFEIQNRLGLPVVGHIPFLRPATTADPDDLSQASARVVSYHRPRSPEAEAFRGVRTSLYFSTRGTGHQVLQVTSPGMGDGKSTIAANLAVSIAQSGKRTVLIDADFRRPSTHKLFPSVGREVGLASVIAGEARLEDAILPTIITNLWIMPCGPRPANPAELLTSLHFKDLLADVRSRFDFVLVDTPPVLMVSDPCAVAPRVDGVLLVIRHVKNNRPAAERAVEVLHSLGANVVGVLVNDKQGQSGEKYGYGYGYGYKYQYGYGYQPAYAETDDGARRGQVPALPPAGPPPLGNGHHSPSELPQT